eukprot:1245187-Prymnesium_polylepis.2
MSSSFWECRSPPRNHRGSSSSLLWTDSSAVAMSLPRRRAVAFARSKSERRSLRRTSPVAPRAPVAAMQDATQRHHAAEAARGTMLSSDCKPSVHAAATLLLSLRSSRVRTIPLRPL